jgi:hypothetical protein
VAIGAYEKKRQQKTMKVELYLTVENHSKFVRGKNKSREDTEVISLDDPDRSW